MKHDPIAQTETVGEFIARYLAEIGVTTIFGVISIHNMPILDAVARQGRIRFVPARGEAGAMNMADAWARVSGQMGVVLTSTGTAAGNAAGAQVEALTAGTPLLHITSTVDLGFADRDRAPIHDVPRQPEMAAPARDAERHLQGLFPPLERGIGHRHPDRRRLGRDQRAHRPCGAGDSG